MNLFRGFDISYTAPTNSDGLPEASGSAHRAISKPLTVLELEAALMKETKMSSKVESWPVSPSNESIWTPLSGPSLWDSAVFSKVSIEPLKHDVCCMLRIVSWMLSLILVSFLSLVLII